MNTRLCRSWICGAWVFAIVALGGACRDGDGVRIESVAQAGSSGSAPDGGEQRADAPCVDVDEGIACGDGRICIDGRCSWTRCGDGFLGGDEECDDANAVLGDGCDPDCMKEPALCGDEKKSAAEECDDGNKINDDECSNACTQNECGNARLELLEECDDGNEVDDDACSDACRKNVCGNARLDVGESCDDGNKNDDDGCTNDCSAARCGDSSATGKEECDDGNETDDDACSNACRKNVCGNSRIDPGEACDGDVVGVTCENLCKQANDVCRPCEEASCRDFEGTGVDLVAGCYENPNPDFVQRCVDAIACARAQGCAYTGRGAEQCYCGDAASAPCQQGMGINGVCQAEFEAAAGNDDPLFVTAHFGDRSLPIGNAVYMLQCDTLSCSDVCVP